MGYESWLEPPDGLECCESDECLETDDDGDAECKCDDHYCSGCNLQCACRCDDDYDYWKDNQ